MHRIPPESKLPEPTDAGGVATSCAAPVRRRTQPPLVALVSPRWTATPPVYLRELTASLLRLGCRAVVITGSPSAFAVWAAELCSEMRRPRSAVAIVPVDASGMGTEPHGWQRAALPLTVLQRWSLVRDAVWEAERRLGREVSCVFFSSLDEHLGGQFLPGLAGRILGRPWGGVYVGTRHFTNPRTMPPRPGGARRERPPGFHVGDRSLRDRRCVGVAVLDPRAVEPLREYCGRPVVEFPDLTDERLPKYPGTLVREILEHAAGRPIIGMTGGGRPRAVIPFLKAALSDGPARDWFFCCSAPLVRTAFTPAENAWIDGIARDVSGGKVDNIHLYPSAVRVQDGPALNSLLSAFSVLVVAGNDDPQDGHLLTKAALLRRPVVADCGQDAGRRVEAYGLGMTVAADESSPAGLVDAIRRLLDGRGPDGSPLAPRWEAYHAHHSRLRLDAALSSLLGALPE